MLTREVGRSPARDRYWLHSRGGCAVAALILAIFWAQIGWAQTVCPSTPQYSVCDLAFEIPSSTPNQQIDLQAEFRSPRQATALVRAFWDGGARWVIRFTP